jgi:hypothetical protein
MSPADVSEEWLDRAFWFRLGKAERASEDLEKARSGRGGDRRNARRQEFDPLEIVRQAKAKSRKAAAALRKAKKRG